MRVLVTGATGFIGQHLVPCLLAQGHQVIAVARGASRAMGYSWYSKVKFVELDLHQCDPLALYDFFEKPDALIHLAWPGLPNYKDLFHVQTNLPADLRLIGALVHAGLRHVIVTGTCFEYGLYNGAMDETRTSSPENPYAIAKDTLRKSLLGLKEKYDFSLQWARLFYMHGLGQNPNSLLAQLDRAINENATEFRMSQGEQLRDYLPVTEVARRLVILLTHPEWQGVINICSGEPISVRRLVEEHMQKRGANLELKLGHYPYPSYEPLAFWGVGRLDNAAMQLLK